MARLREALESIVKAEKVSAHMPGHKYRPLHPLNWFELDTTEIEGTDNLHAPTGILKEAMQNCAKIYDAKWSHFLINGSTVGIIAAILGSCKPGEQILMGRDSHKSVYSALTLHGLNEVVVMPEVCENGEMLGYNEDQVLEMLDFHPDIKTIILTSPTYFGHCTTFSRIVEVIQRRDGILIVDEAHGAHLNFSETKPWSALQQGAHIVIHSAHKMLPALTQAGMIHFNHNITDQKMKQVLNYLSMLQSTSPSYVLMASIDDALEWMVSNGVERSSHLRQKILSYREKELKAWIYGDLTPQDVFKLWLTTEPLGYDGYQINDMLIQNGIMPEFANRHGVLLYLSLATTTEDLSHICNVLDLIEPLEPLNMLNYSTAMPSPKRVIPLSKMTDGAVEEHLVSVPLMDALGQVCGIKVVPYPPGVPLLMPGERVTEAHIQYLLGLSSKHVVLGYATEQKSLLCVAPTFFETDGELDI